jgi:hypothetical protein
VVRGRILSSLRARGAAMACIASAATFVRARAPAQWKLSVGLSVSAEAGFQKREYASDQWTLEIRPIINKQIKRWYLAFNPTLDRSFKGANAKLCKTKII